MLHRLSTWSRKPRVICQASHQDKCPQIVSCSRVPSLLALSKASLSTFFMVNTYTSKIKPCVIIVNSLPSTNSCIKSSVLEIKQKQKSSRACGSWRGITLWRILVSQIRGHVAVSMKPPVKLSFGRKYFILLTQYSLFQLRIK